MIRRTLLALGIAALTALPALAAEPDYAFEAGLGNPKAKVKVTEFASVTCPHCAKFQAELWPAFKKKYVDTGKVYFVFREFPTPPANVSVAGFMVARCSGPSRYFASIEALFKAQTAFIESGDARAFIMAGAAGGGLDEAGVTACLGNEPALASMQTRVEQAAEVDKIQSTPTFLIGNQKVEGPETLAQLEAVIDPLLKAR